MIRIACDKAVSGCRSRPLMQILHPSHRSIGNPLRQRTKLTNRYRAHIHCDVKLSHSFRQCNSSSLRNFCRWRCHQHIGMRRWTVISCRSTRSGQSLTEVEGSLVASCITLFRSCKHVSMTLRVITGGMLILRSCCRHALGLFGMVCVARLDQQTFSQLLAKQSRTSRLLTA